MNDKYIELNICRFLIRLPIGLDYSKISNSLWRVYNFKVRPVGHYTMGNGSKIHPWEKVLNHYPFENLIARPTQTEFNLY